jgi:hypothetical protein
MFESPFLFELNDQLTLVLRCLSLDHVVIVASKEFDRINIGHVLFLPWAVFVALVKLVLGVLAEDLFALFASEDNLLASEQLVVLGLHVALGAVEPLFAALGAN